jgi:hypothetical protein
MKIRYGLIGDIKVKLNQAIALLKGAKGEGEGSLTKAYKDIQSTSRLTGVLKTYKPRDEEGEKLPSEGTLLQLRVPEIMADAVAPMVRLLDLIVTVDCGNQLATANITVDGTNILDNVPVSTLLFLEKKLVDFAIFVSKLPVLDPSEAWEPGDDAVSFKSVPSAKTRTKKIPRNHVKAPATDKHPAQVELYYEDVVVGDWTTINFSGAVTQQRQRELASRVAKLQRAVKLAREEANGTVVIDQSIGTEIFSFLGWAE